MWQNAERVCAKLQKLFLISMLMSALSCHSGCSNGGSSGSGASQTAVIASDTVFADIEPNDLPGSAQILGEIKPGMEFTSNGAVAFIDNVTQDDEFDSFQFVARGAQTVRVTLLHNAAVDMDLAFVDPATGDILNEGSDNPASPEIATLQLGDGQVFNVEVQAFDGAGTYTIRVSSTTP